MFKEKNVLKLKLGTEEFVSFFDMGGILIN